jgi:glycosyltransferase involved in cell wall biosynthesis
MRNIQVQIVQHLIPGGIETMVLDLLRCAGEGREVHVISLEGSAASALALWPRLKPFADKLHFLDKPPGVSILTVIRLVRLLWKLGASAIQTHHIGPLLYGGPAARIAGIGCLVHTEHDAWHLRDAQRRKLQNGLITILRPTLVTDSYLVADELAKVLPNQPYKVIPNGIDCDVFTPGDQRSARKQLSLPKGALIIGCAGRLERVKNHSLLLNAHALLSKEIHLTIAGAGSLESDLRDLTLKLGTQNRVHFLGRIDDMPTFYRSLDVFCLPSEMEGMPLSPLEAQASGIPCVATDVGGTREAVCPKTGVMVPVGSPEDLATSLEFVLLRRKQGNPRAFPLLRGNLRNVVASYQALMSPEVAQ